MALGPIPGAAPGADAHTARGAAPFDYITTAGWIMIAAWLAFIVLWVATFKDPLAG